MELLKLMSDRYTCRRYSEENIKEEDLVCGYNVDEVWRNDLDGDRESGDIDVSIVITHMMLMAEELGLGACWIGRITPELVKKNLDIPENVKVVAVLSLGYHREDDRPSKLHTIRRSNEELVKFL